MTYQSVDKLQQTLAKEVFFYAKDAKKAAGRALGTLVEIITFYLLKDWQLENNIRIEKGLIEYSNAAIAHNVEYTLHPVEKVADITVDYKIPLTSTRILKALEFLKDFDVKPFSKVNSVLFTSNNTIKNACLIGKGDKSSIIAVVRNANDKTVKLSIIQQIEKPFAMVEFKRVGIEEGNKKGPQTIEKAKQGAYVARTVSSLQKVRNSDGELYGVLPLGNKKFRFDNYKKLLEEIVVSQEYKLYKDFILTIGVVSNHGNWFTSDNPNKELVVLKNSYDWLLFLTDAGIASFIEDLLLRPTTTYREVREAFLKSYSNEVSVVKKIGKNQFTKTLMGRKADILLQKFFQDNRESYPINNRTENSPIAL